MEIIKIILLGIVQGLTEFLPVSSSGHLQFFQEIFQMNDVALSLDIILHFGTLFSVLFYYATRIRRMLEKPLAPYNFLVVLTALPAGLVGVFFADFFRGVFQSASYLGPAFLITSALLFLSDWYEKNSTNKKKYRDDLRIKDVLTVGVLQCLAIFPGISRSGSTIAAGLFRDIDKETAAELSFLNSIILILGANLLEIPALFSSSQLISWPLLLLGFISALVSGYVAITVTIRILKKSSFRPFAIYVGFLGLFVLLDGWIFHLIF